MATPGIQYVINTTMGDLHALDDLRRQLLNLRELANTGADFAIRIDPSALNGLQKSVADRVAAGVRQGGANVKQNGMGGGSADLGAIADELRTTVQLLRILVERKGPEGRTSHAAEEPSPRTPRRDARGRFVSSKGPNVAQGSDYIDNEKNMVIELRQRQAHYKKFLEDSKKVKKQDAMELGKFLDQFTDKLPAGDVKDQTKDKLNRLVQRAAFAKRADNRIDAAEKLTKWFEQTQAWLKDESTTLARKLREAEKHLDQGMTNAGYDPATGANNAVKNGRRSISTSPTSTQGFLIDAAAITKAFEHAADVFGQRLMAYLPEHGLPGGGGGAPVIGGSGGSYSTGVGGNGGSALMYKMCRACNGTGRFKGGGVCWRCGGTGDENHPNMHNPELQDAIKSGRASLNKVGNAQSNPVSGTMVQPIIPHSMGQRQALEKALEGMTKPYYGAGMTDDDRAKIDRRMAPLIEELEAGGVSRARYHASPRVVNGMFVSRGEYLKMFGGVDDKGKKVLPDPAYVPQAVEHGIKYSAADPIRATQANINALAAAMKNLEQIDLSRTEQQFKELGDTMKTMAAEMTEFDRRVGKIYGGRGSGEKLAYQKLLNQERERHTVAMNALKTGAQADLEEQRVKERARRLFNADTLTRSAMNMGGVTQMSAELLDARIGRGFKKLGRYTTRAQELHAQSQALYATGLPLDENARDRLQNLSNFVGTRNLLFKDLESAYTRNPNKYAKVSGIGDLNKEIDRSAAINRRLQELEEAEAQHADMLFRKAPAQKLAEVQGRITASRQQLFQLGLEGAAFDPGQSGFINNKPVTGATTQELKASGARLTTEVDQKAKAMTNLAHSQQEQINTTEKQSKIWDRLAVKFRDLTAYLAAGTIIYGAVNMARRALTETMRFEADMASIQGIFIAKTDAQRDQVKTGIMKSAQDFGVERGQVAGIAKMFAQTGASPEKTIALTRATLLASKGAGLEPGQASEMLIAVDNLTKGQVTPADIIDRISRVEARHAVTAQDLSTIIQRAGPMAAHLQPDQRGSVDALDMLMGMGTRLIEKTRVTGNQAGTTLKFLMARLSAPEVQRKLQDQFGIKLAERNPNEMRDMTDIFGDIAAQYNDFRKNGQSGKAASLLATFAGARQANAAAALFDDWKGSMDIARESSMAFGDSQRRLAIQMDTLETKVGQAGTALNNLATVMIEKTGLLALLKGGATAVATGADFMADHPVMTGIAGALGMRGIARYLTGFEAGKGAGAFVTTFAKVAPTLGKLLTYGNVAATGITVGMTAHEAILNSPYLAEKLGGYPTGMSYNELMKNEQLYGPAEFSRETYKKSEQGKAFETLANKYGLSGDVFYNKVSAASDMAMQSAERKFGVKDAHSEQNPKLARFLEEEFTRNLQEGMLPGFDAVKDKSQAVAEALNMLRESIQYGGVAYFAQQGKFAEDAQRAGQEFMQNANMTPGAKLLGSMPLVIGTPNTIFGMPSRIEDLNKIPAKEIGMFYSKDIAHRLGRTTFGQEVDDAKEILNAMSGPLGVGSAFSTAHLGGSNTRTMLEEAIRIMRAGEFAGKGIHSLGEAMDALSDTIREAPLGELDRIQKKGGKGLTAADQVTLDANTRYNNLLAEIQNNIYNGLNVGERGKAAKEEMKGLDVFGGGGKMATMIMNMQEKAVKNILESGKLAPGSVQMQRLEEFQKQHFAPGNYERTRMDIVGALNRVNIRAYLKDKVMDEMFRFAQREGEIKLSQQYLGPTGVSFDAAQERAQNANQSLQEFIKITAGLPIDRMRAAHKLGMALKERNAITGQSIDYTQDLDEEGRNLLTKSINEELKKYKNSPEFQNSDQIRQLRLNLEGVKSAVEEWLHGNDPNSLFDTLSDEDKNFLKTINGLSDENLAIFMSIGNNSERMLRVKQQLATGANAQVAKNALDLIKMRGDNSRGLLNVQSAGQYRNIQLAQGLGLAEARSDRLGALNIRREMITANRQTNVAVAQETLAGTMRTIMQEAKQAGALDENGKLNPLSPYYQQAKDAGEAFQTAVETAYHTAQNDMAQLLGDQHVEYMRRVEDHMQTMIKGLTDPITGALSDPRKLLSGQALGPAVSEMGAFANQKLASSFMDNLVGPEGIFKDRVSALFKSPIFEEAALIKMAHIEGIVEGFRTANIAQTIPRAVAPAIPTADVVAAGSNALTATQVGGSGRISGLSEEMTSSQGLGTLGKGPQMLTTGFIPKAVTIFSSDPKERAKQELMLSGITSEQHRAGYKGRISDAMYHDVTPFGYGSDHVPEVFKALKDTYLSKKPIPDLPNGRTYLMARDDAWRFYLGLGQKHNTFGISDYTPSTSSGKQKVYYKLNQLTNDIYSSTNSKNVLGAGPVFTDPNNDGWDLSFPQMVERLEKAKGQKLHTRDDGVGVMGNYTLQLGKDKQGSYMSYYDLWDLAVPGSQKAGSPYEIYDRIYYDPKTRMPIPQEKGAGKPSGISIPLSSSGDHRHNLFGQRYIPREVGFALTSADSADLALKHLSGNIGLNTSNVSNDYLGKVADANYNFTPKDQLSQKQVAALQLATLASVYASTAVFGGTKTYDNGQPKNYAAEGSQLGSVAGSFIPGLGPVGSIVGAVVGGALGSLFKRKAPPKNTPEYEALSKIERNTRESVNAITNQTRSLLSPEDRLLYAPSTFSVPQMQPFGGASAASNTTVQMQISIPINAGDRSTADLAQEIAGHLKTQLATLGTFTDSRF